MGSRESLVNRTKKALDPVRIFCVGRMEDNKQTQLCLVLLNL